MKVEIKAVEGCQVITLNIYFWRTRQSDRRHYRNKELIDTYCSIFRDTNELVTARAKQSPKDKYNKVIGRKVALTKALHEINNSSVLLHLTKESRRCIWEKFHQTYSLN